MQRLCGLDALRGIAALAVALHHLARIYGYPAPPLLPSLAVDLFFILSGLVMTRTYEGRMRQGLTTRQFVLLRYRRLFLPMTIGSTVGLWWATAKLGPSLELAAAYTLILGFLPAVWMVRCFVLNGPAWSLFVEILANAFHGAVFVKLPTLGLLALWVGLAVATVPSFFAGRVHWGENVGDVLTLIPREISCYLMGVILFRTFGDKPWGNMPIAALAGFAALLFVATLHPGLEMAAVLIGAPIVVRAALSLPSSNWAKWAGALSFPLYAIHVPLLNLAYLLGLNAAVAFAFILIATIAVTALVERPVRRPFAFARSA